MRLGIIADIHGNHGNDVALRAVPFDVHAVIDDLRRRRHPNTEFVTSILTGRRR